MNELFEILKTWIQPATASGTALLLILIIVLGIAAYRFTYRKHIDSNGKVVVTRKLNPAFNPLSLVNVKADKKRKPFSRLQRRILRGVYSVHEALFGLIIFAFGLALMSKVFFELTDELQRFFDPANVALTVLGVIAMTAGVLLIYFRNADNPFDD